MQIKIDHNWSKERHREEQCIIKDGFGSNKNLKLDWCSTGKPLLTSDDGYLGILYFFCLLHLLSQRFLFRFPTARIASKALSAIVVKTEVIDELFFFWLRFFEI